MDDINPMRQQGMAMEKQHLPVSVWIVLGAGAVLILLWAYLYNEYFPSATGITQSRPREEIAAGEDTAILEQELNAISIDELDVELESIEQELAK